ncbi:protein FAR1-RELATED SEQUENCE 5-like [Amborella trichopoda]|uniref:protein FAR1-RELATED SEQUENCE 5-like n=1 Tax=Amborella trichopoda TaxID=13333 RepID=UPI0009BF2D35|nr:protein FAR1-RELATED SEQUENCE 5-like [Amborella trichopoda]XP_020526708.1 protein FAR1-RELATED SEQUENCE 5-like [Amborella trichopoda]XP_020526709.1 protein FAR1-RELATED SEQUENCE 5-like [Amborella trichopoda]XP_020526710.1 protein FAR1-RELATED SEQUENCE 5-like [Amborella trichopoda]|eukprot:XP_020526707.1 protein FAR1-RELATED SEQUENCE 5-like [Amborella trichopoda]
MSFAPILVVNHHFNTTFFGFALIFDEKVESFVWVFKNWLEAIGGQQLGVIITDQDHAILAAVRQVFYQSEHHYCKWHILSKVKEKLFHVLRIYPSFSNIFRSCIASPTIEEFENRWKLMIEKYELESNEWLNRLYGCRMQWVDAYLTGRFTAGMTSTQRSEGINKDFKMYLTSKTSLCTLLEICAKVQDKKVRKEKKKDLNDITTTPILRTTSLFESHAQKIYTQKFLKVFVEEVANCMNLISELVDENGQLAPFKVADMGTRCRSYLVEFNPHEKKANCNCHLYERMGFLCRHVLKIFMMKNIFEIPSQYIMRLWSKKVRRGVFVDEKGKELLDTFVLPRSIRYNDVM